MNKITKYLEDLSRKLNQSQKIIIGFIVAAILFVIAIIIADEVGTCGYYDTGCSGRGPFNLDRTWYVWIIFLIIIGYFEFKLFGDQHKNKE